MNDYWSDPTKMETFVGRKPGVVKVQGRLFAGNHTIRWFSRHGLVSPRMSDGKMKDSARDRGRDRKINVEKKGDIKRGKETTREIKGRRERANTDA